VSEVSIGRNQSLDSPAQIKNVYMYVYCSFKNIYPLHRLNSVNVRVGRMCKAIGFTLFEVQLYDLRGVAEENLKEPQ